MFVSFCSRLISIPYLAMKKRHYAGFFFALMALYLVYPYATLWSISQAIQDRDVKQLKSNINWRAVKNSLKNQVISSFQATEHVPLENELPDFGSSFATTAISNSIDKNVNAENLNEVVQFLAPEFSKSATFNFQTALKAFFAAHTYFSSPLTFHADIVMPGNENKTPLHLTLQLQRWHWKITEIILPESAPHISLRNTNNNRQG